MSIQNEVAPEAFAFKRLIANFTERANTHQRDFGKECWRLDFGIVEEILKSPRVVAAFNKEYREGRRWRGSQYGYFMGEALGSLLRQTGDSISEARRKAGLNPIKLLRNLPTNIGLHSQLERYKHAWEALKHLQFF